MKKELFCLKKVFIPLGWITKQEYKGSRSKGENILSQDAKNMHLQFEIPSLFFVRYQ